MRDSAISPGGNGAKRAILAASVGNLLEWYDFSVYALFAIYIAANFFPHRDPGLDLVKAFLVFGFGFVIRPLGAVLIGIYGDHAGRKAALTLTNLIMGGGISGGTCAPRQARAIHCVASSQHGHVEYRRRPRRLRRHRTIARDGSGRMGVADSVS